MQVYIFLFRMPLILIYCFTFSLFSFTSILSAKASMEGKEGIDRALVNLDKNVNSLIGFSTMLTMLVKDLNAPGSNAQAEQHQQQLLNSNQSSSFYSTLAFNLNVLSDKFSRALGHINDMITKDAQTLGLGQDQLSRYKNAYMTALTSAAQQSVDEIR